MALVLTGSTSIGASTGVAETDEGTAIDLTTEITEVKISATVNTVIVPATATTPEHGRGGAADYSVTFSYLSNDIASSFFQTLWAALTTTTKSLFFVTSMRAGAVGVTNPEWTGVFVVTEASVGAAAATLSTGSATFPMTGPPTKATV